MFIFKPCERKDATSWRWSGAFFAEGDAELERQRIRQELDRMEAGSAFPIRFATLQTAGTKDQASTLADADDDVVLVYGAQREPEVIEALLRPGKPALMFVRQNSGPFYYMYIGVHGHFLRQRTDSIRKSGFDLTDVVVDRQDELVWRLRSLYALKNMRDKRIVTIGGSDGWGGHPEAVQRAREFWGFDLLDVSYTQLGDRIQRALQDPRLLSACRKEAQQLLSQKRVTLETDQGFVERAFILQSVFGSLLREAETDAITVNNCMSTIMPISKTTACLPLMLLNDAGYMALCESDFVAIPADILLRYISETPVFLCNPSFPHDGRVTVSHCTAPSRMDGTTALPIRILTHYESDYGAAPKVEIPKQQIVTILDADFAGKRWLGFLGEVIDSPFYPICRTQINIRVKGDFGRLAEEIRGWHWMVAFGDHLDKLGYALRKAGVGWLAV
ncbi:MAG: sugar isomerase [Acidobacteria bacterium]|nr:sugar isomerase [Acidobacteriota bacterium]